LQTCEEIDRLPIKRAINTFGFQSLIAASVLKFSNRNQLKTFPTLIQFPPSAIGRVMRTSALGDTAWSRASVSTGTSNAVVR
jgi:hypothetical protein